MVQWLASRTFGRWFEERFVTALPYCFLFEGAPPKPANVESPYKQALRLVLRSTVFCTITCAIVHRVIVLRGEGD